jgi:hypothetical protein
MHRAIEQPLDVYLPLSSKSKSIQSEGGADMSKYRLYNGEPSAIDKTTLYGIYFVLHLFREALGASPEEVDLSCLCAVGIPETFLPKFTCEAVAFIPPEFSGSIALHDNVPSVPVGETLAGRTNAVGLILAHGEVPDGVCSGCPVRGGIVFLEAFLEAISV